MTAAAAADAALVPDAISGVNAGDPIGPYTHMQQAQYANAMALNGPPDAISGVNAGDPIGPITHMQAAQYADAMRGKSAWPPPSWTEFAPSPTVKGSSEIVQPTIQRDDLVGGSADSPLAPGLGIPQSTLDSLPAPPPLTSDAVSGADAGPGLGQILNNQATIATEAQPGTPAINPADINLDQARNPILAEAQETGQLPSDTDKQAQSDVEAKGEYYATHPYEKARDETNAAFAQQSETNAARAREAADYEKRETARYNATVQARLQNQAESQRVKAEAVALSKEKLDPDLHRGILGTIGMVLASTLGGAMSQYTGGRNLALEQINKQVADHIEAQKADMANRWKGIGVEQQGVADDAQNQMTSDHDAAVYSLALHQRAMDAIQQKQQDFNPQGAQARALGQQYAAIATSQQKVQTDANQKDLENRYKLIDPVLQKQQEIAETARQHDLEYQEKMGKLKGAGGTGAPTGKTYTVDTGFLNPFDPTQHVMAMRPIGGKGEDPKERNEVFTQLTTYKKATDLITKMHNIADEIGGNGKGLAESVWSSQKTNLGAEYDAAKEELTSILTKAIGDRPTSGQLELQAKRIPDRKTIFAASDPGTLLADQQDALDHAFKTDFGTSTGDADPIIAMAKRSYAPKVQPPPEQLVEAAQQGLAKATTPAARRDNEAALEAAQAAVRQRDEEIASAKKDVATVPGMYPHTPIDASELPGDLKTIVESRNTAQARYNEDLTAFHKVPAPAPANPKLKGDVAAAQAAHQKQVDAHAIGVVTSRRALDAADNATTDGVIHALGQKDFGGLPRDKVDIAARHLGMDPSKFTSDINGQVAEGTFIAKLHALSPAERAKIRKVFLGQ